MQLIFTLLLILVWFVSFYAGSLNEKTPKENRSKRMVITYGSMFAPVIAAGVISLIYLLNCQ